jgi:hypothetical protein
LDEVVTMLVMDLPMTTMLSIFHFERKRYKHISDV